MADQDKSKLPVTRVNVDASPVIGSNNLITSGAVARAFDEFAEQVQVDAEENNISRTYAKIADVIFYEEMD